MNFKKLIANLDDCTKNINLLSSSFFKFYKTSEDIDYLIYFDNHILIQQLSTKLSKDAACTGRIFYLNNLTTSHYSLELSVASKLYIVLLDKDDGILSIKINSKELVLHDLLEAETSILEIEPSATGKGFYKLYICTNWN